MLGASTLRSRGPLGAGPCFLTSLEMEMESHGSVSIMKRQFQNKTTGQSLWRAPLSARSELHSHPLAEQAQACGRLTKGGRAAGPDSTYRDHGAVTAGRKTCISILTQGANETFRKVLQRKVSPWTKKTLTPVVQKNSRITLDTDTSTQLVSTWKSLHPNLRVHPTRRLKNCARLVEQTCTN